LCRNKPTANVVRLLARMSDGNFARVFSFFGEFFRDGSCAF
jgi:hypothetical protein